MCGLLALALGCGTRMFLHMDSRRLDAKTLFFEGGAGNATALLHGSEALLVDAKMGDWALRMQRELEAPERGVPHEVRRLLLTHAHADHASGIRRFENLGVVMLHPNTEKRLLSEDEPYFHAQPYVTVEEHIALLIGGEEVRIQYVGHPAHTDGDLVAYLPSRKLLISGDVWNNGLEPECDPSYGGDILGLKRALDEVLKLPFERVLPGHGGEGTRAQVEKSRNYLAEMEKQVRGCLEKGMTVEQTKGAVKLDAFGDFMPVPRMANRQLNVEMMYQSLVREQKEGRR